MDVGDHIEAHVEADEVAELERPDGETLAFLSKTGSSSGGCSPPGVVASPTGDRPSPGETFSIYDQPSSNLTTSSSKRNL